MATTDRLSVIIEVDGVKEAQRDMQSFNNSIGASTASLIKMGAGIIGVAGGLRFIKDSIELSLEQDKANRKLQNTLTATGNQLQLLARDYQMLATSIQQVTGIGDEIITADVISNMLTFKGINLPDIFERATRAAIDLSSQFGQDLKSSTIQLGKALEDPIKGVSALARVGVTFNEVEKEMIKNLVETGDKAEAQRVILSALEGQTKGAAQAMADPVKKATAAWDDLKETIGKGFLPVVNEVMPKLQKFAEYWLQIADIGRSAFEIAEEYSDATANQLSMEISNKQDALRLTAAQRDAAQDLLQVTGKLTEEQKALRNEITEAYPTNILTGLSGSIEKYVEDQNNLVTAYNHEIDVLQKIKETRKSNEQLQDQAIMFQQITNTVSAMLGQELAIEDVNMALEDTAKVIDEKITPTTIKMTEGWVTNLGVLSTEWKDFVKSSMQLNLEFLNGWDTLGDSMVSSFKQTINRLLNEFITSGLLTLIMSIMTPGSGVVSGGGLFGGFFTNLFGGGGGKSMSVGGGGQSIDFAGTNQRLDRIINVLSSNTGQGMNPLQIARLGQSGNQMRTLL